ncbi:hypothetical protein [Nocardia sp. NBC_01388]|uniref:hypothetical protein n=1 Tax=Nocardia sp. NBC_01388 TaxID=2903596 RepID=UPI0032541CF8
MYSAIDRLDPAIQSTATQDHNAPTRIRGVAPLVLPLEHAELFHLGNDIGNTPDLGDLTFDESDDEDFIVS